MEFSHIDKDQQAKMVNVGEKEVTKRSATAQAQVIFPIDISDQMKDGDIQTLKGPVFHTAIIAGTMGAKKTAELIPLCHPIGLDGCDFKIEAISPTEVTITCTCSVTHKTGVEMEALTGASVAALTIYDMCKSISKGIILSETKLLSKTGGKSDYQA